MKLAIALLAALLSGCASASATPPVSAPQPAGQQVVPPFGFIDFCVRQVADCSGGTDRPATPALTPAKWSELSTVNDYVNALPQIDDEDNYQRVEYWTYPGERGGDCEDLALAKRKLLIERGWPVSALLLATAEEWNGEFHAVLIVETDRGEFVLDNLNREIVAWHDAPYVWKKRQSRERPFVWVDLDTKTFRAETTPMPRIGEPPFVAAARSMKMKLARTE